MYTEINIRFEKSQIMEAFTPYGKFVIDWPKRAPQQQVKSRDYAFPGYVFVIFHEDLRDLLRSDYLYLIYLQITFSLDNSQPLLFLFKLFKHFTYNLKFILLVLLDIL